MQINTLYLPLKEVKGGISRPQSLNYKVLLHIKRFGELPKYGRHGYYNKPIVHNAELTEHITALQTQVELRLQRLLKASNCTEITDVLDASTVPHWSTKAGEWNKQKCKLLCEVSNLCRAKVQRQYTNVEVALYHINTAWLALNRLVYGKETNYKNAQDIAYEGNFIPIKERFYGKRKRR